MSAMLCRYLGQRMVLLVAVILLVLPLEDARADTYRVGVVPQFEPVRLAQIWSPILDHLEARTGHRFILDGTIDIPGFEAGFAEGRYDFAYMNPYHAVGAMRGAGYVPLVRDGGRQLSGVLVVSKDSTYQSPADLEGQRIDFPAPNALGASLLMRAELDQIFGIGFRKVYAATHSSAYLNVVLGQADAAGGVMSTLRQQPEEVQNALRVIHTTTSVAPHPLMAQERVPPEVRDAVAQALLEWAQTDAGAAVLQQVPFRKLIMATEADYDPVAALRLEEYAE